jgi:formamidopyrimidine-DNA glycosylase
MLKTTLMNQGVMAGIGNVYSDEILYQARLHPRTKVNALEEGDLRRLYDCMQEVLDTAIACRAVPEDFPDSYLTPLRGKAGTQCPGCGGEIERIEVSGRGAYYCPECQKKKIG